MKNRLAGLSVAGALVLIVTQANAAIDDTKANELLSRGGCMACHTVDKTDIVGPSFKEIALRNRFNANAHADIVRNVRQGVTGMYGNRPMPAISKRTISDIDLSDVIEWLLSR